MRTNVKKSFITAISIALVVAALAYAGSMDTSMDTQEQDLRSIQAYHQ